MIAGCTVVELRADRTPGEQGQGAYSRIYAEQVAEHVDPALARVVARLAAAAVVRNAQRNGREHSRQGLATERFVSPVGGVGIGVEPEAEAK